MNFYVDHIIVGQGLAGSALAWELIRRGKSLMVFDDPESNKASSIAAGLFNPITGRVLTKTWMADHLFPFLENYYKAAEAETGKRFIHQIPIYRPFLSMEERQQWERKILLDESNDRLLRVHAANAFEIPNPFGGMEIVNSGYVNVMAWTVCVKQILIGKGAYSGNRFREEDLQCGEQIRYQELTAGSIIFCDGISARNGRFFQWLPLKPLKGETIDVKLDFIPQRIFNRGAYLVPTEAEGIYKVGATYQHPPFSESITAEAREQLVSGLGELIGRPFEVVHQDWGIRPTSPDRRPMLGAHPANKNVIAFNGLGTKGVSLSPYFAHQLAAWLDGRGDLSTEVNINRFKTLYSG
jgi:glycine oxidase